MYNGDFVVSKGTSNTDVNNISGLAATSTYYKVEYPFTGSLLGLNMMQIVLYVEYFADGVNINSILGGNAVTTFCYVPVVITYSNGHTYYGVLSNCPVACYTTDVTWYFVFEWAGMVMRSANLGVAGFANGGMYSWANDIYY